MHKSTFPINAYNNNNTMPDQLNTKPYPRERYLTAEEIELRAQHSIEEQLIESLNLARKRRNHHYRYLASKIRKCNEEIAGWKTLVSAVKERLRSGVIALDAGSADKTFLGSVDGIKESVTTYEHTVGKMKVIEERRAYWVAQIRKFQEFDEKIKGIVANMSTYCGPSLEDKDDNLSTSHPSEPITAASPTPEGPSCKCTACEEYQHIAYLSDVDPGGLEML
ncbi:uncharacterized protein J4E88_010120 [Alternaria novae-zelandiae]|uniref:uncharacterized protein n=1 Tax=Alternaria triticimaculans TaxID=297637 RepID=UPI0020C4FD87|nr:uncharacterized protein J4E78_010627 [Alternaria triticimaculans]XP_049250495.1 uncharacterized protein J4E88_010120 [Alternaria novae-zelandiae]KAI4640503.1 hypothetical protein J4E78_010627 [Alternaria triticimaculans]KAI4667719.1 hypothetical protein J4E88_010120 [Alternaria novae-zelandiae]